MIKVLKVGDVVRIRRYDNNPSFWDNDGLMFGMMGQIRTVSRIMSGTYRLHGSTWVWKHKDLVLMESGSGKTILDPNHCFKFRNRRRLK